MTTKQLTEFDHPAAWTAEGLLAQTDKWVYELTEDDLAELDAAQHLLNTTWYMDWRGEEGTGEKPYYAAKLYTETPKGLTCLSFSPD
jgi:hypothetical protein